MLRNRPAALFGATVLAGVLAATDLADTVHGTVGRYSPYAVYLPGGDPGQIAPVRDFGSRDLRRASPTP